MNNNNLQNPSSDLLCINNKNLDWSEMRIQNIFLFLFIYTTMIHCTTIGIPNPISKNSYDFSETVVYRLCILQDEDVSDSRVNFMVNRLTEELKDYNIKLEIPFKNKWTRNYFFTHDILYNDVVHRPLPNQCDRLVAFASRGFGDFLFSFFGEVMGVVETVTRTKGVVYADYFTFNVLIGATPSSVLIHENYHFLGCNHSIIMNSCYESVFNHKKEALKNKKEYDFFPSLGFDQKMIPSREIADLFLTQLKEEKNEN